MDLTADLLGAVWYWAALPVVGALLLQAARGAPWRWLSDSTRLNVFLGTVVSLVLLWSIRTGIRPGLGFHLLGATACTLMFGPRLALMAMTLVMLGAAVSGSLQWWSLPLNIVLMGAVPVAVSWGILRAVERWLPAQLFVYLFVAAFFGAAAAMLATGLAASMLLGAAGAYSFEYLGAEYAPWFLLMAWAEAFTTGAAVTLMVVYRPDWVATFDDARYLRNR
jgi:uncharacterized membrane protein